MNRAFKQILVCAAALIVFCIVCRFTLFNSYSMYVPLSESQGGSLEKRGLSVEVEAPDVLKHGETQVRDGYMVIPIEPEHAGESFVSVNDAEGKNIGTSFLKVGPLGTVYMPHHFQSIDSIDNGEGI